MSPHAILPAGMRSAWVAASAVGAAGLAIGGFHYAALWPASRIFGRSLVAGPDPSEIALTYDDGPNDPYTWQLMDVLARHSVRATFFVIGRYVRRKPEILRALRAAGHEVGCHTMTHPKLMYMGERHIRAEIADAAALIEDAMGARVRLFRPPFGSRNPALFRVTRELELRPALWNVNTRDWKAKSPAEIEARIHDGVERNRHRRRGSNILMHDGSHLEMGTDRRRTVNATANMLGAMTRNGVRFVTLDQW